MQRILRDIPPKLWFFDDTWDCLSSIWNVKHGVILFTFSTCFEMCTDFLSDRALFDRQRHGANEVSRQWRDLFFYAAEVLISFAETFREREIRVASRVAEF